MEILHTKEVVTCEEMKQLEQMADVAGLTYYEMMENAGTKAAQYILDAFHYSYGKVEKALILCGKGNNGGDGFVVARKFHEAGIDVSILLVEGEPVTKDAITNYNLIKDKITIYTPEDEYLTEEEDIIVDAIYGTGFHGQLKPEAEAVIRKCNEAKIYIASLDLPSGLGGDMTFFDEPGYAVWASHTVTFHAKKPVHGNEMIQYLMGKIEVADIGIGKVLTK